MADKFDLFVKVLEEELLWRYQSCEDFSATPSSVLLSVLNAVAEARNAVAIEETKKPPVKVANP